MFLRGQIICHTILGLGIPETPTKRPPPSRPALPPSRPPLPKSPAPSPKHIPKAGVISVLGAHVAPKENTDAAAIMTKDNPATTAIYEEINDDVVSSFLLLIIISFIF